jgi:hypothetical protein
MKNWRAAVVTWKKDAPPSAMIVKPVHRDVVERDPVMSEKEQREGMEFVRTLRETLSGVKTIPQATAG